MLVEVGKLRQTDRISKKIDEVPFLLNTDHVVYADPGILKYFDDDDKEQEIACWNVKVVTGETFVINAVDLSVGREE